MAATYCSEAGVSQTLQLTEQDPNDDTKVRRLEFTTETLPTLEEVTKWIEQSETIIENETKRAWKSISIPDEYHKFEGWQVPGFHIGYGRRIWFTQRTVVIKLYNSKVTDFASGTDKIEYFDGSDWTDIVATGTKGDSFGEGDFWPDLKNGVIYLYGKVSPVPGKSLRVTYRYGAETTVPLDIQRACELLTAIRVMESDDYVQKFAGAPPFTAQQKSSSFRKEALGILRYHKKFITR